jgi:hypothetical protein
MSRATAFTFKFWEITRIEEFLTTDLTENTDFLFELPAFVREVRVVCG